MWANEKNVHNYSSPIPINLTQSWILSRLEDCVYKVNNSLENYDIYIATAELRTFFYKEFCDVFLVCIYYSNLTSIIIIIKN